MVVLYADDKQLRDDELAIAPTDVLGEQLEVRAAGAFSLPATLRILASGTSDEKLACLLDLHKRLYHEPAEQMKRRLRQAGVPIRTLALCADAVQACVICKRWESPGTRPNIKLGLSARFNFLCLADLVFFEDVVMLVIVDEAIRYTVVTHVDMKTFDSLEQALRRSWLAQFGPMKVLRIDRERALAHETFGVYCEKVGIVRELVCAADDHTRMSILDRRVRILRAMRPRLADSLAEQGIELQPADEAAELQMACNTQISHNGVSPYMCLYGVMPNDLMDDDVVTCSSEQEGLLPFFQHQLVRTRAIQAFQEGIHQARLLRAQHGRPRTELQQLYKVGSIVDIFRRPVRKDLTGWRGPCTIVDMSGDGTVTVKWQGQYLEMPIRLVRPHVNSLPIIDTAL